MMTRLKQTIAILRAKENHHENMPDVVFLDDDAVRESAVFSRRLIDFLQAVTLVYVFGIVGGIVGDALFPAQEVSTKTFASILVGMSIAFMVALYNVKLHEFVAHMVDRVRLSDYLYPYFGHRLEKTYWIIKG